MTFLADQCAWGKTIKLLRAQSYEVITLKELGKAGVPCEEIRGALVIISPGGYRIRRKGVE
jgi:hypothetical protein